MIRSEWQIRGNFLTPAWPWAREKWQNSEWQDFDGLLESESQSSAGECRVFLFNERFGADAEIVRRGNQVPVEMRLYAHGGHAFALRRTKFPITGWPQLVETWLGTLGMIPE